jgi:hypothetical protein
VRLLALAALALAAIWFGFVDNAWLDRRPVQRLLFLGHSLTYYNDMPAMVAKMADSADSPIRYAITMSAFPNAGLDNHWNNRRTRELLAKGGWDRIIAQPERSYDPQGPDSRLYFYANKLLVGTAKSTPAIVISQQPTETFYRQRNRTTSRSEDGEILQKNLRGLAIAIGADVIDVASVWDRVRLGTLPFPLYKDGNHPSLEGSYLAALVIYANLSHSGVNTVTYVPWGMSSDDAALLRNRVQEALDGNPPTLSARAGA